MCKDNFAGSVAVPVFLIAGGAVQLMNNFGLLSLIRVWDLWPLILVAIGVEQIITALAGQGRVR